MSRKGDLYDNAVAEKLMLLVELTRHKVLWVIQSKNGSYGTSYSFTYDNNYTDAFYVAPNGDEYAIRNQKMYRNDSLVNTDYIHESDYSNQYGYQKRHIYMEDANVRAIHVGAV